jgi:hypothetical protein
MPLTKVSAGVIAANAVVDSFGTQSITGDKLGLTAINANNIVGASITGDKLGLTAINANNIVNASITGAKLAANTVSGDVIGQNAISSNNIVSVNASVASVGTLPKARLPANSILQVVQTTKTDTFSSSSTSFVDITGLTATITPSSTSSRILVIANVAVADPVGYFVMVRLARGGSAILQGDAAGSRTRTGGMLYNNPGSNNEQHSWSQQVVDSPASTSTLTYSVQLMQINGATHYVNRLSRDENADYEPRSASSIILMEIAG